MIWSGQKDCQGTNRFILVKECMLPVWYCFTLTIMCHYLTVNHAEGPPIPSPSVGHIAVLSRAKRACTLNYLGFNHLEMKITVFNSLAPVFIANVESQASRAHCFSIFILFCLSQQWLRRSELVFICGTENTLRLVLPVRRYAAMSFSAGNGELF